MKNRNKQICLRLTEEEKRLVQEKAQKCGLKTEPFIRRLINNEKWK